MTDYGKYLADKPGAEPPDGKNAQATTGDRLLAEVNLLLNPIPTGKGIMHRLDELSSRPQEAIVPTALGLTLGAATAALGRGGNCRWLIANLGKVAGVVTAVDVGARVLPAVGETWSSPGNLEHIQSNLGQKLGSLAVDFGLMGAGGYAGGKLFVRANSALPGASLTQKDVASLSREIKAGYKAPEGLAKVDFADPAVISELNLARTGGKSKYAELDDAVQSLQGVVDKWTASRGLPKIAVEWYAPNGKNYGSAPWAQPTVRLEATVLAKSPITRTGETLIHELTHIDQHVLLMRRIADRMGVGATATARETNGMLREFRRSYAPEIPDTSYLNEVIRLRKGQPLSPAQTARADRLMATGPHAQNVYQTFSDAQEKKMILEEALQGTKSAEGSRKFLQSIRDSKETCAAHFNSEIPPASLKEVCEFTVPGKAWSAAEAEVAQRTIQSTLTFEKQLAHANLRTQRDAYGRLIGETEAFGAGRLAGWNMYMNSIRGVGATSLSIAATGDLASGIGGYTGRQVVPLLLGPEPNRTR